MYPSAFDYYRATSVANAIALLQQHDGAKLVAGGHSLLPMMKLRLAEPPVLIDIARVPGLKGVQLNAGATIGALTTYRELVAQPGLAERYPALVEAAASVGDVQVRNRGTIGGGLAHSDPAADLPAAILVHQATLTLVGPRGSRSVAAADFFVDVLTTALAADELLTEIVLPAPASGEGSAYVKFPHPASGYAIVGVAAVVTRAGDTITGARLAVTGAGAKAVRRASVETALVGQALGGVEAAVAGAADGIDLNDDLHASAAYREHLVRVFARRAVTAAFERARG